VGSRLTEIVVDCHDAAAQAGFWAAVLGYQVVQSGDHWVEIAPWEQEPADLASRCDGLRVSRRSSL
jgi:Glyoxalase-like domain